MKKIIIGLAWAWASTLVAQVSPKTHTLLTDIAYADTGNSRHSLDVLLPLHPTQQKLPVVVYIHGGGWRGGSKATGGLLLQSILTQDFVGVSINYRLSSEATWPAQIHDCKAAIRWLRANANLAGLANLPNEYGPAGVTLDTSNIAVWGSSAGGHLAAMLGVSGGGGAELEGTVGSHTNQSSRVQCVVDYFGPSDLLSMLDYPSNIDHGDADSPESRLIGGAVALNPQASRNASPTTYVSSNNPPFFIAHGDQDTSVPYQQSVLLRDKLRESGVEVVFTKMVTAGHGDFLNPELDVRLLQFLQNQLLGGSTPVFDGSLPNGLDADGDLILDAWEQSYGFNPEDAGDASLDADGDGQSNFNEFLCATDPHDIDDSLQAIQLELTPSNSSITFKSTPGLTYKLYGSADFKQWRLIKRNILASNATTTVVATGLDGPAANRRFYLVELE